MAPETPPPRLSRVLPRPVYEFLQLETAGGAVLMGATVLALLWANSPWAGAYDRLWTVTVTLDAGPLHVSEDLRHLVNDGLMTLFFFVVGLEIKRELVAGGLRDPRAAALPAVGALGGMVVPAVLYASLNAGGAGSSGWGIPMATDIAFAVGVVALLGSRVPADLRLFLLTLAIVDDIGAIAVIAVFYTADLSPGWLGVAAGGLALVVALRAARVTPVAAYAAVGVVAWFATLESGVHATIAGVALGLLTPAEPLPGETTAVTERLEHALHPWTSFVVVPLFALANAGISLGADDLAEAASSPVAQGVVLGLVVGKVTGITGAAWLAVRLRFARLPEGVGWRQMAGIGMVAGIGFTVSLFIAGLAFAGAGGGGGREEEAKAGILVASILAAALGGGLLRFATNPGSGRGRVGEEADGKPLGDET